MESDRVVVTVIYVSVNIVEKVSSTSYEINVSSKVLVVVRGIVMVKSVEREVEWVDVALSSNVEVVVVYVVVALIKVVVVITNDPMAVVVLVKVWVVEK